MTRIVIVGEIYNADLSVGGGPMPGGGGHPSTGPVYPGGPVDPGYGRPVWGGHPDQGLPGGGHISTGPVWGGRPDNSLPWAPVRPGHDLPNAPVRPDQGLPPGVTTWPPSNTAGQLPAEPGIVPENPIVVPAPPEGTVVMVWVSGVGYRYVTIGEAEPK